jgi:hypothetical protein
MQPKLAQQPTVLKVVKVTVPDCSSLLSVLLLAAWGKKLKKLKNGNKANNYFAAGDHSPHSSQSVVQPYSC